MKSDHHRQHPHTAASSRSGGMSVTLDNFINRDSLIPAHHTRAGEGEGSEARAALQSEIVIGKHKKIDMQRGGL